MYGRLALGALLIAGAAMAACGGNAEPDGLYGSRNPSSSSSSGNLPGRDNTDSTKPGEDGTPTTDTTPSPGTNNGDAKAFFGSTVFTALSPTCGGCHDTTGPGPAWLCKADVNETYLAFEAAGYIATGSRIEIKGTHASGGAPALTADQSSKYRQWITMELQARGNNAPVNIKEKLGGCFDEQKFNAIGLQNLRTTRRNNENANNCTGCNQAPCMTCHTNDDATGFILAFGNNNVPQSHTFEMSKKVPFIDKYFGTNGADVVASNGLQKKSEATIADKPYTHPMYRLSTQMQQNLDAFVQDVITKQKAGQCK